MNENLLDEKFLRGVGGKRYSFGGEGVWDFGYRFPQVRSDAEKTAHSDALGSMPAFAIRGEWKDNEARYPLWQAGVKVLGKFLPYNHQLTGSCVGAGGGNAAKTLMCVEIALKGEAEEYRELWWPFTYGKSRERAGMRSPGEGSLGSSWAQAATQDGIFARVDDLPAFREVSGWLQLSDKLEYQWSDGDAIDRKWIEVGRQHLIKTAAQIRNSQEARAALANGYPLTLASMFGTRGPRKAGNPTVNLAEWDASWAHQMFCDEAWDHPTLGLIFRIGNNWGPGAHPAPPSNDSPPGGFYVTAKTFDRICQGDEVFALSAYAGYPARSIDWVL